MGKGTKVRTVRIEDALWDEAKAKADKNGDNLSDIMRDALRKYLDEPK